MRSCVIGRKRKVYDMKSTMLKILCTVAFFAVLNTANAQQRDESLGGFNFVSIGATQIVPTGGLSNYFASTTGVNLGIGLRIHRLFVGFQAQGDIAGIRLKKPLLSSTTGYNYDFQKGDRFYYMEYMGNIGYILIIRNWFELMPFVGFGGTSLRSNLYEGERNRDEFTIFNSFTFSPGLRVEFPLKRIEIEGTPTFNHLISLRLDAGYNMPVRFRYTPARGNVFFARASIVWWFGDF